MEENTKTTAQEKEQAYEEFYEKYIKPYADERDEILDHAWQALIQLSHEFRQLWEKGKRFDEMYYWLKDSRNRLSMMSDRLIDESLQ